MLGNRPHEELWFRGSNCSDHELLPSLLWQGRDLSDEDLWTLEQRLFFEFQARARELHERGLTDWDFLFFMRHHGVPTRILDWTDSFGAAVYFALEREAAGKTPCIWALNPYALNEQTDGARDLVQPKYLAYDDDEDEFWEFGEALATEGDWRNDGPVAIYPLQISERMRSQRGWFTFHGNVRASLDEQFPTLIARIELRDAAIVAGREFLDLAGLKPYTVYPDLDHLADEVWTSNQRWITARPKVVPPPPRATRPGSSRGPEVRRRRRRTA